MNNVTYTSALGILALTMIGCGREEESRQPNIILITIDDLGWADVGCYGSTYYETPNIDRLAAEGIRFTTAYAAAAICSPTRAALMTGKAPARTGVTDWIRARFQGGDIPEDNTYRRSYEGGPGDSLRCPSNPLWLELEEMTIAEALKGVGYTTAHIGKWHLGPDDWYPERQGFDINIGGCDYGQPPSYFDPYSNDKLSGIYNLPPRKTGEYLVDRLADEAVNFIVDHRDGPFFLNMADYAVHTPIQGKPELVEKYRNKPTATGQQNPEYAAMVESMDMLVGRIAYAVDSLGIAENTLIVFTSDNGGLLRITDNTPLRSGKGFPYEGGIRVPLIVRYAGTIAPRQLVDEPVISHDMFLTLCTFAGVNPGDTSKLDGVSLAGLLTSGEELASRPLYWHFPHYRYQEEVPYSIIRQGDWKLIKRYEGNTYELFNLTADPRETEDLAARYPDRVKQLDNELTGWLSSLDAALPRVNPDYRPSE